MSNKKCTIAVVGCGVVGGGTAEILFKQKAYLEKRNGLEINLKYICDIKFDNAKNLGLPESLFETDYKKALADEEVNIVVELIGGTTFAKTVIEESLKAKKNVVTANKALLAKSGVDLFKLARENGVSIGFEASCGGGIPLIRAFYDGLMANEIEAFIGIINGTCNFILSEMISKGKDYASVLKSAQEAGLAEADPTLDVTGYDTAHKLAILSSLAFSVQTDLEKIPVEGINNLQLEDIAAASEMGYTIKLLAIAKKLENGLSLSVRPSFIKKDHPLAWVSGSYNAVSVYGNNVGHTMYYGKGAGSLPTASAVVSDILSIGLNYTDGRFNAINIWPDKNDKAIQLPISEFESRFYIRLKVEDKVGVLANVTKILSENGIGITEASQKEPNEVSNLVSLILTTHKTNEGLIKIATEKLQNVKEIKDIVYISIVDEHNI